MPAFNSIGSGVSNDNFAKSFLGTFSNPWLTSSWRLNLSTSLTHVSIIFVKE